jgi:hypothetical protein
MGFLQLLKTLDELLYELMSWLVFFPVTLWRAVTHPLSMMTYADNELGDRLEDQYSDTLSPPLFLLICLLLSHAAELAMIGENGIVASKRGLAGLVNDDTTLIILRLLLFSIFPIVMATRLIRATKRQLTRDTLRLPFYAQCYPTAPLALGLGLASMLINVHDITFALLGAGLIVAMLIAYGTVQIRWFARELGSGLGRGFLHASIGMVESLLLFACIAPLFLT